MVVTGGPGTGKTTIINAIIRIYHKMGQKTLLAAPTGRAAKENDRGHVARSEDPAPSPRIQSGSGAFKRNETNPLEADLIIIDEASMVDTVLMYQFLKAAPSNQLSYLWATLTSCPPWAREMCSKTSWKQAVCPLFDSNEIFPPVRAKHDHRERPQDNRGEMPVLPRTATISVISTLSLWKNLKKP